MHVGVLTHLSSLGVRACVCACLLVPELKSESTHRPHDRTILNIHLAHMYMKKTADEGAHVSARSRPGSLMKPLGVCAAMAEEFVSSCACENA